MKAPFRRGVLFASGLPLLFLGGLALASRSGDDRSRADALVASLSADPTHAKVAHEAIEAARHSLRRADEARASGDQKHAPELDALAREHAETGGDVARAADAEKKLAETQRQLTDVETKINRARAVLEETLARRGRAQAKLDELEKRPPPPTPVPPAPPAPKRKGGKR